MTRSSVDMNFLFTLGELQRMVRAYDQSARTLNLLRAFAKGGFADITRVHEWNQEFVRSSREGRRYEGLRVLR